MNKPKLQNTNTDKYVDAAINGIYENLLSTGEGGRNATLFKEAVCAYEFVYGGYALENEVTSSLTSIADGLGLKPDEIKTSLKSAKLKASKKPRVVPDVKPHFPVDDLYKAIHNDAQAQGDNSYALQQYESIKNNSAENHEYLTRKKLEHHHGIFFTGEDKHGSFLAHTLFDSHTSVVGYERIYKDKKMVSPGAGCNGVYFGVFEAEQQSDDCYVTEGAADALSILEATNCDTYSATSSSNLLKVANVLSSKYQNVIIALDNDEAGHKAALKINGQYKCVMPSQSNDYSDVFVSGGDMISELQNEPKLPNAVDANYGGLSKELFSSVSERVCSILSVNSLPEGTISLDVIDNVLNGSTWYAQQSKYYLMNHDNNFIPVREKDGVLFFSRTFGNAVDLNKISSEISTAAITNEIEKEKMESRVKTAVWGSLFDELRYRKHMTAVHYQVDMFISQGHVRELNDGVYSVVMPHKELKTGPYDHAIVDDFKEHFPFFCDFLDLLVNARFAPDRKKAYLWLQATSDFGKGFLTGALEHHGLVVSMTAKETESIFEGKPSSRQATDFLRAWALIFNEFKSVKSELKELESTIQMSPKNQMVQRAEIFAKVFFSADGVASMTGEHGVETQFANRFSYKKLSGNIEHRAMFKSVGKGAYMRSIQNYIAEHINKSVSTMRQLGKEDAEKVSSDWVDAFHTAHGIRNAFGDTADNIGEIADDFKAWCLETYRLETHLMDSNQRKIYKHLAESKNERVKFGIVSHDCLVTKPKTVFDIWVDATYSRSEKGMILKMKDKILEAVGDYTKHTTKQGKRANAYLIKNE